MGTKYAGTPTEILALNTYIRLQRAAETSLSRTTAALADIGLTVSQFSVLEVLYHLGSMNQRDLGEKLLKSPGNVTSVLKTMERRGLISRERSEVDNRQLNVMLTEAGRSLISGYFPQHVAGIVADMAVLTPEEQAQLGALCRKLGLREPEPQKP